MDLIGWLPFLTNRAAGRFAAAEAQALGRGGVSLMGPDYRAGAPNNL
jgi:hypothetical protein